MTKENVVTFHIKYTLKLDIVPEMAFSLNILTKPNIPRSVFRYRVNPVGLKFTAMLIRSPSDMHNISGIVIICAKIELTGCHSVNLNIVSLHTDVQNHYSSIFSPSIMIPFVMKLGNRIIDNNVLHNYEKCPFV